MPVDNDDVTSEEDLQKAMEMMKTFQLEQARKNEKLRTRMLLLAQEAKDRGYLD